VVYFELVGKWFNVIKIRNLQGKHTGYYCDIATPPKLLEDGSIETTDLFLDLWVSPDLRYRVLDDKELDEALKKGWITKQLYEKARKELKKLAALVEQRKFPPLLVRQLEEELRL
jgi:predicted RNA-binding protein associated with RNAse of E/G family